jgi:hypothetical protein
MQYKGRESCLLAPLALADLVLRLQRDPAAPALCGRARNYNGLNDWSGGGLSSE